MLVPVEMLFESCHVGADSMQKPHPDRVELQSIYQLCLDLLPIACLRYNDIFLGLYIFSDGHFAASLRHTLRVVIAFHSNNNGESFLAFGQFDLIVLSMHILSQIIMQFEMSKVRILLLNGPNKVQHFQSIFRIVLDVECLEGCH
jgi:hypothetical protein